MNKNGTENSNHNSSNWVCVISEKSSSCTSTNDLGGSSKKVQSKKEEVEEETNETDSEEDEAPLGRGVYTASCANLAPCSITNLISSLFIEINITKVS